MARRKIKDTVPQGLEQELLLKIIEEIKKVMKHREKLKSKTKKLDH